MQLTLLLIDMTLLLLIVSCFFHHYSVDEMSTEELRKEVNWRFKGADEDDSQGSTRHLKNKPKKNKEKLKNWLKNDGKRDYEEPELKLDPAVTAALPITYSNKKSIGEMWSGIEGKKDYVKTGTWQNRTRGVYYHYCLITLADMSIPFIFSVVQARGRRHGHKDR